MKRVECRQIVAYRRTSTDDQRLGIEAQDVTLKRIAAERGLPIVKTFTEHESGGNCERRELDLAIRFARQIGAVVVVAKLDRLARDSGFLMRLFDGNVPIVFGDMPEVDGSAASRLMIQVMAAFAEFERRRIGERTREALAVLKANGVRLGTPRNLNLADRVKGAAKSARLRRLQAVEEMSHVTDVARPMRDQGATLTEIADHLNQQEYMTRRGSRWRPGQVARLLDRAANA